MHKLLFFNQKIDKKLVLPASHALNMHELTNNRKSIFPANFPQLLKNCKKDLHLRLQFKKDVKRRTAGLYYTPDQPSQ